MENYLFWTLCTCFGFGIGAVMQKHGMASKFPAISMKTLLSDFKKVAKTLAVNKIWTIGVIINLLGAYCYVRAVALGSISIVQPMVQLTSVVAISCGVLILKEKLSKTEVLGAAVLVGGAVILGTSSSPEEKSVLQTANMWILTGGLCGLLALINLTGKIISKYLSMELIFAISAGLLFGVGSAFVKVLTIQIGDAYPVFVLNGESLMFILTGASIWFIVIMNVVGFVLMQLAFSHGRVALANPVITITTMIPPILFGFWAFGEAATTSRVIGILIVMSGTAILILKSALSGPGVAAEKK